MVGAGIDVGSKNTKAVVVGDGKIIGYSLVPTGFDQKESAQQALDEALEKANVKERDLEYITSTGAGRGAVTFATHQVTEVTAAARGGIKYFPSARTIIDVGAEGGTALKCDANGKVIDFAVNDKCAAGAGTFVETMARTLEVQKEDMGALSLQGTAEVAMNAQCTVFAESEVVSLIHQRTPKADIAKAVHEAISSRVSSMVKRVGLEKDVALIGGVAKNSGFLECIKKDLGCEVLINTEKTQYISAYGAALTKE